VQDAGHKDHWKPGDWVLHYDGKSAATDKTLWTEKPFGDFVLIADWRIAVDPKKAPANADDFHGGIALRGDAKAVVTLGPSPATRPAGEWNRVIITAKGDRVKVEMNGMDLYPISAPLPKLPPSGAIGLIGPDEQAIEFASIFVRELK
jgi:hypothetical protein